jgi:hypothetical protein
MHLKHTPHMLYLYQITRPNVKTKSRKCASCCLFAYYVLSYVELRQIAGSGDKYVNYANPGGFILEMFGPLNKTPFDFE